jgi:iron-sulfur cluster assembly accessory protein
MITVSSLAIEKLKDIIVEQGEEGSSLRVMLMPGANGGAQYMLALETEAKADDTVINTDGVNILIDPDSAPLMEGAEIDYMDGLMKSGFVINNPNIAPGGGGCGCGGGGGGCGCGGGAGGASEAEAGAGAGGCACGAGGGGCACGGH